MRRSQWLARQGSSVRRWIPLLGLSAAMAGCGGGTTASGPNEHGGRGGAGCSPGTEGCPCYANETCNAPLTCASRLCVNLGSGGSGQGGTSTGGTPSGGLSAGDSTPCLVGDLRSCADGGLYGTCAPGMQSCRADGTWSSCTIDPAAADTCVAGNDDNCNGTPNDGCECLIASTRSCAAAGYVGNCGGGQQVCESPGRWGPCSIQPTPADTCQAGDDANCNATPNEGCTCLDGNTQPCGDMVIRGLCHQGVSQCSGGSWGACENAVYPQARDCRSADDNDCDGTPDNAIDAICQCTVGATQPCQPHPQDGIGPCHAGKQTCVASADGATSGWGACTGSVGPAPRDCRSAVDNDCDGSPDNTIDAICRCAVGTTQPCETHAQDGIGPCRAGTQTCVASADAATSDWGACTGSVGPGTEVCNDIDDNCDGFADEGCPCPGTGGPAMVRLPDGYCIDSTEVTRAEYEAWLTTNPSTAGQISGCTSNTTFTPAATCTGTSAVCQTNCSDHPQVCIDWCDAYAYCLGVGKRLCGRIGGGTNGYGDNANAAASQWYRACISGEAHNTYAYGAAYDASACNAPGSNVGFTLPVGSMASCQSPTAGYREIYDLTGNVSEWEDSCNGVSEFAYCWVRGGNFGGIACGNYGECASGCSPSRLDAGSTTGFRCCS